MGRDINSLGRGERLLAVTAPVAMILVPLVLIALFAHGHVRGQTGADKTKALVKGSTFPIRAIFYERIGNDDKPTLDRKEVEELKRKKFDPQGEQHVTAQNAVNGHSAQPARGQKNNDPCSASQEIYSRAKRNLEDDKEEQALAEYDEAISKNVSCAEPYMGRGIIFFRRGEYAKAIVDINKAIELDPRNKTTYMFRGLYFQKTNEDRKAVADFTKNIELCTKNNDCSSAVYVSRGESYWNLKELDKAIEDFTKAISIEPGDADTYYFRALAYFTNNAQLNLALADTEKAISLDDKKGSYYQLRGSILCIRGISEENISLVNAGLRDLTRAIELQPDEYNYYAVRATMYRRIGETEKADADQRKAEDLKGRRFLQKTPNRR